MYINSTPQLSEECTKEILAELEAPKKDSPMLQKLRKSLAVVAQMSKRKPQNNQIIENQPFKGQNG